MKRLIEHLSESTDTVCPVAAGCEWNGKWHFATNQIDSKCPKHDINNRTELFYATCEHAEIGLLKKLGDVEVLDTPVYVTLFPCDQCIKVLHDKGVKKIFYMEDHPERNWSKRSHAKAEKWGMEMLQKGADDEL